MRDTLFATFATIHNAELALGALLDHGVNRQDLSVILCDPRRITSSDSGTASASPNEAETGSSSETAERSGNYAGLGYDICFLAGLHPSTHSGDGILLGKGSISQALVEMTGGGATEHSVMGTLRFLIDQGVPCESVLIYSQVIKDGGALVSISVPSGDLSEFEIRNLLTKHTSQAPQIFHLICDTTSERVDPSQRLAQLQRFASL